jgi:hypothetical protein
VTFLSVTNYDFSISEKHLTAHAAHARTDTMTDAARRLTLEWIQLEDGSRALVFDADTWAAFEKAAQAQGKTAHQLISTAVGASVGTVMMENYALNRWLKNDDPDFFRQMRDTSANSRLDKPKQSDG